MTITLELKPEVNEEIARQVADRGMGVGAYAEGLLEEAAQAAALKPAKPLRAKDMVELFEPVRGLNIGFKVDRHHDKGRDVTL